LINCLKGRHFQRAIRTAYEHSQHSDIRQYKSEKTEMATVKINFWRTIALAFVCQQVEQATAMTMLGPSRKEVGLNLV